MNDRRFRTAVLALMLICLLAYALPAGADTAVRMEGGLLAKGDNLWLGHIAVTEGSKTYDGPIPWQVLDPDNAYDGSSGGATLLSRYTLALTEYGTAHDGWIGSTIRASMQAMAEDRTVFSQGEYDLLLPMTTNTYFPLENDRLFPLLPTDLGPDGYLTTNAERQCYAIADKSLGSSYWLRFYNGSFYVIISNAGTGIQLLLLGASYPMRPAASIKTGDIALYASPDGKRDGDAGLATNGALPTGEYVLTLYDSSRTFSAYYGEPPVAMAVVARAKEGGATVTSAGGTVNVNYDGATLGRNEYISAMVTGGGAGTDVLFYGRVRYLGETGEESGTVAIGVPAGLKAGGDYTLRVFSEQHNGSGDGPSRRTDYISYYSDIPLAVTGAAPVPGTGDAQMPGLWGGLAGVCAAGITWLWLAKRRVKGTGGKRLPSGQRREAASDPQV